MTPPPAGEGTYNITGGTRPNNGPNLFHSFESFSVGRPDTAQFLNTTPQLTTSNIFARVIGGSPSSLFGTIDTLTYGNANLFLINPSGVIFGPNATLNVGGIASFSTAEYIRLGDNGRFSANLTLASDILTTAPVAAFGFLGSNPRGITVRGGQLSLTEGRTLALVGGDITIGSGAIGNGAGQISRLSAPRGQIHLASAKSPGEFQAGSLELGPNINGQSFGALGSINISERSVINVSGNGGGTVLIRSGNFVLDNSTISANISDPDPFMNGVEMIGGGIDIQVTEKAVIQPGSLLETNVLGNASPGVAYGGTYVKADRIEIIGDPGFDFDNGPFTEIHSYVAAGSTGGNTGPIKLEGNSLLLQDFVKLHGLTEGAGNTGNIILHAKGNLELNGTLIEAESVSARGNASSIELTSTQGNILMTNGPTITSQTRNSTGNTGNITVSAQEDVLLAGIPGDSFISGSLFTAIRGTGGTGGSGKIQITAKNLTLANATIAGDNLAPLPPGNITMNLSGTLSLDGQSLPGSGTFIHTIGRRGGAPAADLTITAHDIMLMNNSTLSTETRSSGAGGILNIFTENLKLTNGGILSSGSVVQAPGPGVIFEVPSGPGGTINVQGLAGGPTGSILIDGTGSGIFSNTEGTGAGGAINLSAKTLTLQNGGTLSAATTGAAQSAIGGSIVVNATDQVTLTNGASITASSTGPADAGNISINAGQQLNIENGNIRTEANQSKAGNINLQAIDQVRVVNGEISTSVHSGAGRGGDITIDPKTVILQDGTKVFAQAVQGSGGNITITTPLYLKDSTSFVNADSQFGLNGSVTIQSPTSNLSGTVGQLASKTSPPQVLVQNRCVALAGGEQSTFILAGRDALPSQPGGWLSSPVVMEHWTGENMEEHASGLMVRRVKPRESSPVMTQVDGTEVLSLRRLTPFGFLVRSFAESALTGCRS
ncbi:MAG: filamentous hemagglutinin N-terminal domain-containing protein [Nitrospira sp.]|nr:filamentous hemagglutinin N-terminal domain-containing protein [Nitrospira sp.]MDH5320293.1 filamentous hemagglutinin N-terminal domain-containing protein [Nitrospira sp.]